MLAKLIVAAALFNEKNANCSNKWRDPPHRVDTVKYLFTNVGSKNKTRSIASLWLPFYLTRPSIIQIIFSRMLEC
jgi:hypothetical protein